MVLLRARTGRPQSLVTSMGVLGELEKLLTILSGRAQIMVFLGDYVDRGEQSAGVLHRLKTLQAQDPGVVCLKGNRESMMLKFLDDPAAEGPRWLRNGGLQTLASFGLRTAPSASDPASLKTARDDLRAAMGEDLEYWLRNLPLTWQSGNVAVTHAGADPGLGVNEQASRNLIWGHSEFRKTPGATVCGSSTAIGSRTSHP